MLTLLVEAFLRLPMTLIRHQFDTIGTVIQWQISNNVHPTLRSTDQLIEDLPLMFKRACEAQNDPIRNDLLQVIGVRRLICMGMWNHSFAEVRVHHILSDEKRVMNTIRHLHNNW